MHKRIELRDNIEFGLTVLADTIRQGQLIAVDGVFGKAVAVKLHFRYNSQMYLFSASFVYLFIWGTSKEKIINLIFYQRHFMELVFMD